MTGFTLIEIMIVVVTIGLLAAIAVPAFNKIRESSQASRVANDMRVFRDAIQAYSLSEGSLPEHTSGGLAPEFVGWIGQGQWNEGSGFANGVWEFYNPNDGSYIPEIVLDTPGAENSSLFQKVDATLDDGSAATGDITYDDEYILLSLPE
ncbi:MAG: type II secretion system protein [Opitutales bacterium]